MTTIDELEQRATERLTEVARGYARARRYRAIAADCETVLGRALTIGGVLREHAHDARIGIVDAVHELDVLLRELDAALRAVRAGVPYRAALAAWNEGRLRDVAAAAPAIFDGVSPDATARRLYLPIDVTAARGGEHFRPAAAVAEHVGELLRAGIPRADPPPGLGADEHLGAVVFDTNPETTDSPVTLVVPTAALTVPYVRLEPAGDILVYAPRLAIAARVRLAPNVSDEWWAVRPDAYIRYGAELTAELAARGIDITGPHERDEP